MTVKQFFKNIDKKTFHVKSALRYFNLALSMIFFSIKHLRTMFYNFPGYLTASHQIQTTMNLCESSKFDTIEIF